MPTCDCFRGVIEIFKGFRGTKSTVPSPEVQTDGYATSHLSFISLPAPDSEESEILTPIELTCSESTSQSPLTTPLKDSPLTPVGWTQLATPPLSPVSTYVSVNLTIASLSFFAQDRFNLFQGRQELLNKLSSLSQVENLNPFPVPASIDSDASHW
jgi:hypothetical protein